MRAKLYLHLANGWRRTDLEVWRNSWRMHGPSLGDQLADAQVIKPLYDSGFLRSVLLRSEGEARLPQQQV